MNTSCNHQHYHKNCQSCLDIYTYCASAEDQGIVDFQGYGTKKEEWEAMKQYYNKCILYEPEYEPETELEVEAKTT